MDDQPTSRPANTEARRDNQRKSHHLRLFSHSSLPLSWRQRLIRIVGATRWACFWPARKVGFDCEWSDVSLSQQQQQRQQNGPTIVQPAATTTTTTTTMMMMFVRDPAPMQMVPLINATLEQRPSLPLLLVAEIEVASLAFSAQIRPRKSRVRV